MSQHLIVDFLNRRRIFKPFRSVKLINHKNNVSPEDAEQNLFNDKLKQHSDKQEEPSKDDKEHIDINV